MCECKRPCERSCECLCHRDGHGLKPAPSPVTETVRESPALLPCAFCGSKIADVWQGATFWVECDDCDACGPQCNSERTAIAAWNRRLVESSAPSPIDQPQDDDLVCFIDSCINCGDGARHRLHSSRADDVRYTSDGDAICPACGYDRGVYSATVCCVKEADDEPAPRGPHDTTHPADMCDDPDCDHITRRTCEGAEKLNRFLRETLRERTKQLAKADPAWAEQAAKNLFRSLYGDEWEEELFPESSAPSQVPPVEKAPQQQRCIHCGVPRDAAQELTLCAAQLATTDAAHKWSRPTIEVGTLDADTGAVNLHDTMDAVVWAREYCRINPILDEGMMLAWFANAIMAGYDEARRRYEKSEPPPVEKASEPREWKPGDEALSEGGERVTLLREEPRGDGLTNWLVRLSQPGDRSSDHVPFRVLRGNLRPLPESEPEPKPIYRAVQADTGRWFLWAGTPLDGALVWGTLGQIEVKPNPRLRLIDQASAERAHAQTADLRAKLTAAESRIAELEECGRTLGVRLDESRICRNEADERNASLLSTIRWVVERCEATGPSHSFEAACGLAAELLPPLRHALEGEVKS